MTVRLTRRGFAVAAGSALSYGGGMWLGYPVFRALSGVGLSALIVAFLLGYRPARPRVIRTLTPPLVARSERVEVTLRMRGLTGLRQAGYRAVDCIGSRRVAVTVPPAPAGTEAVVSYTMTPERRGKMTAGPLTLDRSDPFGLAGVRYQVGDPGYLWVHPRVHELPPVHHGHFQRVREQAPGYSALRGAAELKSLREYGPGDEPRHIHWKATARNGVLIVRELLDEAEPRFAVMLDTRPGALTDEQFEVALEIAASLLVAANVGGHECWLRSTTGFRWQVPGGTGGADRLLTFLAEVELHDLNPTRQAAPAAGDGGGPLVLLTGNGDQENGLRWLARAHTPVVVVDLRPSPADVASAQGWTAREVVRVWNEVAP